MSVGIILRWIMGWRNTCLILHSILSWCWSQSNNLVFIRSRTVVKGFKILQPVRRKHKTKDGLHYCTKCGLLFFRPVRPPRHPGRNVQGRSKGPWRSGQWNVRTRPAGLAWSTLPYGSTGPQHPQRNLCFFLKNLRESPFIEVCLLQTDKPKCSRSSCY